MKRRWAWLWSLTYQATGDTWRGTCPVWAAQPVPAGATLTRQRVMVVGPLAPCTVLGCGGAHAVL